MTSSSNAARNDDTARQNPTTKPSNASKKARKTSEVTRNKARDGNVRAAGQPSGITPHAGDLARFADAIFKHADTDTYIAVRAFADRDRERPPVFTKWVRAGLRNRDAQILTHANTAASVTEAANFCPPLCTFKNGSSYRGADGERARATRADVANGLVVTLDFDQHPVEGLRKAVELLGRPTIVVATGGEWVDPSTGEVQEKVHAHWLLTEPTRTPEEHADLVELRERVAEYAGADPSGVPLPHPFRWAGSVHRKGTPKLARIVELNDDAEIELVEVLDRLRPITPNVTAKREKRTLEDRDRQGDVEDIAAALSVIVNPGQYEGDNTYEFWNRVGMAAHAASDGAAFAAWNDWSAKSPKYKPTETADRWEHFERHPASQLGMGTLVHLAREAEPGWISPSLRRERERVAAIDLNIDGLLRKAAGAASGETKPSRDNAAAGGAEAGSAEGEETASAGQKADSAKGSDSQTEDANLSARRVDRDGSVALDRVERKEIAPALAPPAPWPVHVLPKTMREAIEAAAERSQAPIGLCADTAITAVALAAQGCADVRNPGHGGVHPLSLFVMTLGESGERKSTVSNMLMRAVLERENRLRKGYEAKMADHLAAKKAFEAREREVSGTRGISPEMMEYELRQLYSGKPIPPRKHTILHEPTSIEGLKRELHAAQLSAGIISDEGGAFLGSHAMKKEQLLGTITSLSRMWDGRGFKRQLAKDDDSFECQGRRVTAGLMIQPEIAKNLLSDETAVSQGFMARFLVSFPTSTIGHRPVRQAQGGDDHRLTVFNDRLATMLATLDAPEPKRAGEEGVGLLDEVVIEPDELDLPVIEVGAEAWVVWSTYAGQVEAALRRDADGTVGRLWPVKATAIKSAEQALRIAGCLHIFEGGKADGEISAETMRSAVALASFYLEEALRLSGGVVVSAEDQSLINLSEFLDRHTAKRSGPDKYLFSPSVISNKGPAESRKCTGDALRKRLARLQALGHVEAVEKLVRVNGQWVQEPVFIDGKRSKEPFRYIPRDQQ